jgi:dipeptidyl aminopeptidase/acylaminoacyl peptidase
MATMTHTTTGAGAGWGAFAAASPEIAAKGRGLLERSGIGEGLLATVRGDLPPRIHPVHVRIVDGRLLTFVIVGSSKAADLAQDGRYALHAHQDPAVPHEFQVRGRAMPVRDPERRAAAAAEWSFTIDDGYELYELAIEHAVFGERASAEDWPPVYTSWRPSRH